MDKTPPVYLIVYSVWYRAKLYLGRRDELRRGRKFHLLIFNFQTVIATLVPYKPDQDIDPSDRSANPQSILSFLLPQRRLS